MVGVWLLACAGSAGPEAPAPAPLPEAGDAPAREEGPRERKGKGRKGGAGRDDAASETRAFSVKVTVDPAVTKKLEAAGETMKVMVQVYDEDTEQGTFRKQEVEVPLAGGTVDVAPVSTAPGPLGVPLGHLYVWIRPESKSKVNRIAQCNPEDGSEVDPTFAIDEIPAVVSFVCRPI